MKHRIYRLKSACSRSPLGNRLWGVAWMSFFWSTSSLMVFSILPAFVTEELGASHTKLGLLEGVAVSCAFFAKILSGIASDYVQKRKPLIAFGTVFSFISKPLFALSFSYTWLFWARFLDRFSKGLRSSPTDALIADLTERGSDYGAAYGFRQAFYTFGAVFGAFLAIVLMKLSHNDYRFVFWVATLPMAFSLSIIAWGVKDPAVKGGGLAISPLQPQTHAWTWQGTVQDIKRLPGTFWYTLLFTFFLMLARFSEAFVTLRAKEIGWSVGYLPVVIILMDLVHAGVAYPSGRWADRLSRSKVMWLGMILFLMTDLVFIRADSLFDMVVGLILLGCHMGLTQGLLRALVAESTPPHLRGTAFALFYFVEGLAVLGSNIIAGRLADTFGLWAAFAGGGFFVCICLCLLGIQSVYLKHIAAPYSSKA